MARVAIRTTRMMAVQKPASKIPIIASQPGKKIKSDIKNRIKSLRMFITFPH
jgi:hypothetical protein